MKRTLLIMSTFLGSFSMAQDCSELFISEYVEGWSNNKALEIYNPTNSTIDLSQYIVVRFSNGANTATPANAVALEGTVGPHDVHVAVLEKLDPLGQNQDAPVWDSLQARADEFYCPDYNITNAFYWNGNDVVALAKGSIGDIPNAILVDIFGKLGENPGNGTDPLGGWTADFTYVQSGAGVTADHSLISKSTVLKGVTDSQIAYFNPLGEYDSIPPVVDIGGQLYGNWFTLGSHTCDCDWLDVDQNKETPKLTVFPNPSNGEFYVNGAAKYSSIVVLNSLGQEVRNISNNSKALVSFDLGDRRGVYFVKLRDASDNTITKRVIIK